MDLAFRASYHKLHKAIKPDTPPQGVNTSTSPRKNADEFQNYNINI